MAIGMKMKDLENDSAFDPRRSERTAKINPITTEKNGTKSTQRKEFLRASSASPSVKRLM